MTSICQLTAGEGRYQMHCFVTITGEGVQIYLGGGERPHIGTIVVAQPRLSLTGDGRPACTTSVFNLLGHKDDIIAIPLAEEICKLLLQIVVVTAGVHVDKAGPDDITALREGGREILVRLREYFTRVAVPDGSSPTATCSRQ
ncbi:MAG: hypothetical protein ACOX8W_03910 [bacterium]